MLIYTRHSISKTCLTGIQLTFRFLRWILSICASSAANITDSILRNISVSPVSCHLEDCISRPSFPTSFSLPLLVLASNKLNSLLPCMGLGLLSRLCALETKWYESLFFYWVDFMVHQFEFMSQCGKHERFIRWDATFRVLCACNPLCKLHWTIFPCSRQQFEFMSQHLVFANCIPLILKFLNQNISAFIAAKNTWVKWSFCSLRLSFLLTVLRNFLLF